MGEGRDKERHETERGFGTGLRDQLLRKREATPEPVGPEHASLTEPGVDAVPVPAVAAPAPGYHEQELAVRSSELAALAGKLAERESELDALERKLEEERGSIAKST